MGYFGIPFRNGVPIGLGSVVSFGAQQFDPSELFVGGTAGAWYDPSDLTTLFTTSAGTTQCAMPGLGSAVSVGLMLDKSQGLVLGSDIVTNGNFTTDSNWNKGTGWAISGGAAVATATSDPIFQGPATGTGVGTTVGKFYVAIWDQVVTSGSTRFRSNTYSGNYASSGRQVYYFTADSQNIHIYGNSFTGTIDNLVVRELPGNHAIAFNDTTARPELRARVNLLVATATLSTQSVTTQATSYTLRFAGTGSITLSGTATGSYSAGTHTITCTAGTLTLTVSGTVTTADLRPANSGALLPAYQAVVDANTYDTSGFPLYLRFDGVDDSMYTPANLNLSGTDKVAVFAGVRKLSDAAQAVVTELSASVDTNNGSFRLTAPDVGSTFYSWVSKGTNVGQASDGVSTAPITSVLSGLGDIGGDSAILRVNGTQAGISTADQGTGNFGTYPLFIGARNNSSLWFNGNLHSLIIAGSAVSAGNISATESWVAGRTGIQI